MWIKKGTKKFEKTLDKLQKDYAGKAGGPDSETFVNWHKLDAKDGYVRFWSDNKDVASLITRSRGFIEAVDPGREGVDFMISTKGFRSGPHCFKISE